MRPALFDDLKWGVRWGLAMGSVYLLFAGIVMLAKAWGGTSPPAHVQIISLLALYPIGGAVAGLIVGLLRPLLTSRRGAMVVGIAAALPVSLLFLRLVKGPFSHWNATGWSAAALGAIFLGAMGGYIWWGQMTGYDFDAPLRKALERQSGGRRRKPHREDAESRGRETRRTRSPRR